MWNAIANMVIKASDNINRGVENAGKAGEGNNGQDYQIATGDSGSSGGGNTYTPTEQDTSGVESASAGMSKLASMGKDALSNVGKNDEGGEKDESQKKAGISGGNGITDSDERLKNIFGDDEDAIKCFAKIKAIKFTYNDKAKEIHPNGENQVDDDIHYGVKAQDLLKNPLTASAVEKDESGYLAVNTPELTMANSAVISELCRRIEILEKILGVKVV